MNADERTQIAFGKALREFRASAGVSQDALAARAGMNRTYVGDIERGERNVSIVNQQKLAKALDVKLSLIVAEMEKHLGRRAK
jgi:transcriptional regulator with XRE-family HTH domain